MSQMFHSWSLFFVSARNLLLCFSPFIFVPSPFFDTGSKLLIHFLGGRSPSGFDSSTVSDLCADGGTLWWLDEQSYTPSCFTIGVALWGWSWRFRAEMATQGGGMSTCCWCNLVFAMIIRDNNGVPGLTTLSAAPQGSSSAILLSIVLPLVNLIFD